MRAIPFLLSASLATAPAAAQLPPCAVVDAATGRGVPFANVYVPDLATGVVTDVDGRVRLSPNLQGADPATPVTVSCIGYADADVALGTLSGASGACGLELAPRPYALPGAEVSARAYGEEPRELGFRKDASNLTSGYGPGAEAGVEDAAGAEVGNVMSAPGAWWLQEVGLNVHVDTATLAEVNVYALGDDGEPGARLHAERILVHLPTCTTHAHATALDLRGDRITGEGAFLVTLEPLGPGLAGVDTTRRLRDVAAAPPRIADADALSTWSAPDFNSKVALRGKRRVTRYRGADGRWRKPPLGLVVGIWATVREAG